MPPPELINFKALQRIGAGNQAGLPDGRWVPAKSLRLPAIALGKRLRLAWAVFTGRYDAFDWEQ